MGISDYRGYWEMVFQELEALLSRPERSAAEQLLDQQGVALWSNDQSAEWTAAAALLALAPAALHKRWAKVPAPDRPLLWLRLRYLVRLSANAAAIGEAAEDVTGMEYRKALRSLAQRLHALQLEPTEDDLLD